VLSHSTDFQKEENKKVIKMQQKIFVKKNHKKIVRVQFLLKKVFWLVMPKKII
jgi:hypothetical protein